MSKQRTLIIGGASGIGFAVAQQLAARGDSLILAGRNGEKLQRAAETLRTSDAQIETIALDIANEGALRELSKTLGQVDHIVVTAGSLAPGGTLSALDLSAAKQAFDTKFWGSLAVVQHLASQVKTGGTLTLTSGFLARRSVAGTMVKTTINAALEAAVKIMAKELSPLRVNAVSPGLTDTEAYAAMAPEARQQMLEKAAASLPAKTWGRAEDIAKGYLFIIDNPFVTGSVVDIEGGALID
ncbi:MAG: SDR family oxidoreductase [Rouxiella badensis]|jgi:NAD(P)-dependent dehydrogenase (short-subunit alcohol dehydrogenase family)|uniref:SDR family oxidoreductase n=1 Tax=Rouxiella badensis TaxID=1646377 RepID=UPI0017878A23|nr:SDR family oxidoreductase [Rouxiella badensis]QOI55506.1 SDR family oxidoreductase [Rouxiella badensis subsp. acadiensis]